MKKEIQIKLIAVDINGKDVNSNNCQHRVEFVNRDKGITVTEYENGKGIVVRTTKREYHLTKHVSMNMYRGFCLNHKVRITLKKMVGVLTYWI